MLLHSTISIGIYLNVLLRYFLGGHRPSETNTHKFSKLVILFFHGGLSFFV